MGPEDQKEFLASIQGAPGLTADRVRAMMPNNRLKSWVDEMDAVIEQAAREDRSFCSVPQSILQYFPTNQMGMPQLNKEPCKSFVKHYRDQGFVVEEYYADNQLVDLGLRIRW